MPKNALAFYPGLVSPPSGDGSSPDFQFR